MVFHGFTPEAGAFLWDLSFNNERPWFLEHREQFEQALNRASDAARNTLLERVRSRVAHAAPLLGPAAAQPAP